MNVLDLVQIGERPEVTVRGIVRILMPSFLFQVLLALIVIFAVSFKVYLQTLNTNCGYELAKKRSEYLVLNRHLAQLEYQQNLLLQNGRIEKIALNQMDFREPKNGEYVKINVD